MLLYLGVLMTVLSSGIATRDIPPRMRSCIMDYEKHEMPSLFTYNERELKTNHRILHISAGNFSECLLNITDAVETYNFSSTPVVGYFKFACAKLIRLIVEPYKGLKFPHIVQYIKIDKCVISLTGLNEMAGVGTVRVILIFESMLVTDNKAGNETQCSNLKSVASFVYQGNDMYNFSFDDVLNCTPVFENLAEVIFSGCAWSTLTSTLQQKCPNLQSLDIPNNKFTEPSILFPWKKDVFNLPGDLARSKYMQMQYVEFEYLKLPNNVFRRTYRLDNNLIRTLANFTFQGFLHYISIKGNKMVEIGENTFSNVTGVQYISLRENELSVLPCNTFKALNELSNLDLSKNKLVSLCNSTFDSLHQLINLNLANNSLTVLSELIFKNLINLKLVHLEFNDLIVLNPMSFPLQSLELNELYVFNNPLQNFPEFIFWIRLLSKSDLSYTNITLGNFTYLLETMNERLVEESAVQSLSYLDYKKEASEPKENPRIIDLSYSQITGFNLIPNLPKYIRYRLRLLLLNFKFILKGNPLYCDCNILPLSYIVNDILHNESIDASRFTDWTCTKPIELKGRSLINVRPQETYCSIEIKDCPLECDCFKREVNHHVIVDCRGRNLSRFHENLPLGTLELWYSENTITTLSMNSNFIRAISLDISSNKIGFIDPIVSSQFVNTKHLFLRSNLLSSLPRGFEELSFSELTLSPNPFSCDCNTLWMKNWLISQISAVADLSEVTCFVNNEDGNIFVNVPNDQFVCDETVQVDTIKQVVLPSVLSTVIVVLLLTAMFVIYAYRQECKVLMFVYFGVHPFDKDCDDRIEQIDCVIVHSGQQTGWVMENIVQLLESEQLAYKVCDMARDFVVGFSFQENLTKMVKCSKRILFCITKDWDCNSESFIMSWSIAQEKIKETRSNFGIVVTHEVSKEHIKDKDMLRFLQRKRNVDTRERLFTKKLLYYMPTIANSKTLLSKSFKVAYDNELSVIEVRHDIDINEVNLGVIRHEDDTDSCHAFISYCYDDIDYVTKQLQPLLENQGFKLCIPDRDFIAGASKETNILHGIQTCKRTILILSMAHVRDEWSLFTFRHAYEKSLRQKNNHLIVILLEDLTGDTLDEEIRTYLNHYVTLRVDDTWYVQKLFNGLPLLRDKEHLHTSPLYSVYTQNETYDVERIMLQL